MKQIVTWEKYEDDSVVDLSSSDIDFVSGGSRPDDYNRKGFFRELREVFSRREYCWSIDPQTGEGHWVWGY